MRLQHDHVRSKEKAAVIGVLITAFAFCTVLVPSLAFAGMILGAELRFTYEDNVVGLLSDQQGARGGGSTSGPMMNVQAAMGGMGGGSGRYMGSGSGSTRSPGDFYATLAAEAGGYTEVGSDTALFAKAFANHSSYNTYTALDATIGGLSAGINTVLNDSVSARLSALGKIKRFGDSERNSTAYAANFGLKEKLTPVWWVREFAEYEKNSADVSLFSYTGATIGIGTGYGLTKSTTLALAYSYLEQRFEDPSGGSIRTQTASLSAEHTLMRTWSVGVEYNHQVSQVSISGTSNADNILSLALRYSY